MATRPETFTRHIGGECVAEQQGLPPHVVDFGGAHDSFTESRPLVESRTSEWRLLAGAMTGPDAAEFGVYSAKDGGPLGRPEILELPSSDPWISFSSHGAGRRSATLTWTISDNWGTVSGTTELRGGVLAAAEAGAAGKLDTR